MRCIIILSAFVNAISWPQSFPLYRHGYHVRSYEDQISPNKLNIACLDIISSFSGHVNYMAETEYAGSEIEKEEVKGEELDTIRVRIWRTLSSGEEMTLKQLGIAVGERRLGDLKSHLVHVEKQAKTLKNKNTEWKERRGLSQIDTKKLNKMRIKMRKGGKNDVFIRLQ